MRVIVKMLAKSLREHPKEWKLANQSANFLENKKHPGFTVGVGVFDDSIEVPILGETGTTRIRLGLLEHFHLKAAVSACIRAPTDARLVAAFLTGK